MVRTSLSLLTLSLLAVSLLIGAPVAVSVAGSVDDEVTPFRLAIDRAERSLASGDLEGARALVQRALERDRRSTVAWDLRARWAKVTGDRDEQVYARHQQYRLAVAQGFPRREVAALKKALLELDPLAVDLMGMKDRFLKKLEPIAKQYEKSGRPHSAIRVSKQILALDPENLEARAAIERIAASPDPSLAGDAKPKDLFEDVTDEWMAEFDAEHGEWKEAGELKRENYITVTDAGYEVLVRTAEAMEQMNAFYRQFFRFGTEEHGGSVPRIRVHVFKTRDEYLTLGIGPPIEWSAGHFTGGAVECYVENGFMNMVGVLFHEAAHQFVSLATSSVGWLNEGLASFFEGTRILPNGTVIMNMPANGRLFPLATRMEKGWMAHAADGFNPADSSSTPETAPTFRIVVENRYGWGPPWYAPTWGLVYFLYNYQDPVDGRYVYRTAFMEFVDKSGGKSGNTAVKTFEEVVLANPQKPFKGVERLDDDPQVVLPQTIDEVDAVWKQWILELRDEVSGISDTARPYLQWGRYAVQNDEHLAAREHFEKGLVSQPDDLELLLEFADLLQDHFKNPDRAAKLALEALYFLELAEEPDEDRIKDVERILNKLDPKRKTLTRIQDDMAEAAHAIVESYAAAGLDLMVMDVAWRAARDLRLDEMVRPYAEAVARSGKSLAIWELAYNEQNLDGWVGGAPVFDSDGSRMVSSFGTYDAQRFDFNFLTLDRVTSGDFSMEAEISAEPGEINFCGFVFGQKDPSSFHGLLFFPGNDDADDSGRAVDTGYLDLMSSYGSGAIRTWLHVPVDTSVDDTRTTSEVWRRLRLDVVGSNVDIWYEGELVGIWEFPSRDVLHGGFGLLTGPGQARYRNVRFLSRDILDPAGAVERGKRMAALEESGGTVGGSYQGRVPPFPEVADWIQGERSAWDEVGPVPQLLVLFSMQQNELVRIDEWLRSLADRHSKVGLEIVCVAQATDGPDLEAYLADHPMPGAVAVDARVGDSFSFGSTFETFSVPRFNLPRLVLLDLDRTVVWEGDPGFGVGVPPMAPYPSFLDDPLEDLIVRRRLESLAIWRRGWPAAREALTRGDLAAALPTLRGAIEFDGRYAPQARKASGALRALEDALADLSGTAERFAELGRDPALQLLLDWASLTGIEADKRTLRSLKSVLGSKASKDWEKTSQALKRFSKRRGEPAEKAIGLFEDLGSREGAFVVDLTSELRAAAEAGDWETFEALVVEAPTTPLRWLARSHLGW